MKNVLLALSVIAALAVLETNGKKLSCIHLEQRCFDHSDCCTEYCSKIISWFPGKCQKPEVEITEEERAEMLTVQQNASCLFPKMSKTESDILYERFGENGAHVLLPPFSQIAVKINNNTIFVAINDDVPKKPGVTLELSPQVAQQLNITSEGPFECQIELIKPESLLWIFLKNFFPDILIGTAVILENF